MTDIDKDQRYGLVIARCRSTRYPAKIYEIRKKGSAYSCNCRGWAIRKDCKHTLAASKTEGRNGVVGIRATGEVSLMSREDARRYLGAKPGEAARPILMVPPGAMQPGAEIIERAAKRVEARQQRENKKQAEAVDPIALAARETAARILMWGRNGISPESAATEIEKAIRRFAGLGDLMAVDGAPGKPGAAAALPERGVREIVLED